MKVLKMLKLVSKNSSLEQISEDARKSLLARNKIFSDANDIINNSITIRKNILSKNVPSDADLLKDSKNFRENNISKNDITKNFR